MKPLRKLNWLIVVGVAGLVSACSLPSIRQPINEKLFYKRDLELTVNGQSGVGVIVVPQAASYSIKGKSIDEANLIQIFNCHRSWETQELEDKSFSYSYVPSTDAEKTCAIRIGVFAKENSEHGWADIFISDPNGVKATSYCNGEVITNSTSACQAFSGLEQEIRFEDEMQASPEEGACNFPAMIRKGKVFKYIIPTGNCELVFGRVADAGATFHRLYTVGYQAKMMREK